MNYPVVFYDGECGFCSVTVQFVLDHERGEALHFCALQSETARVFLASQGLPAPDMSTFYFWDGKKLYQRSTGGLNMLRFLKAPWSWFRVLLIVPRFIRDAVYDWIAKRRHRLVSSRCALPTPEQRKRFIA